MGLIKYAKAMMISAMVGRAVAVVALALPVAAMVISGGGEVNFSWRLGA